MKAPWRNRFLNIVERTFVELNIEFVNYSIGQVANSEPRKRTFDNTIQGIEFADELTVCSEIVNDSISSPMINGDLDEDNKQDLKFYRVNREITYSKDSIKRVDITVQRVNYEQIIKNGGGQLTVKQKKTAKKKYKVSFIEAKRAKRYAKSILTNQFIKGRLTCDELRKNIKAKFRNTPTGRYNYILIWGVWNKTTEKNNTPENYLNKLLSGTKFKIDHRIRWIPLSWDILDSESPPETPEVDKWCWVLLGQVS